MAGTTNSTFSRRGGIGFSLFLAFGTIAALPLLGALVGGLSLRALQAPIDDLDSTSVRFVADYRELISAVIEIERLMNMAADGMAETRYTYAATAQLQRLEERVTAIDYPFMDPATTMKLRAGFDRIETGVQAIVATSLAVAETEETVQARHREIQERTKTIERLTRERATGIIDEQTRLRTIEGTGNLRFWAGAMTQTANEAVIATSANATTAAETRFAAGLRSAIFQLSLLPSHPGNAALAIELNQLFMLGRGTDNLFALQSRQLSDRSEIKRLYEGLRGDVRAFLELTDALMSSNSELTGQTLEAAEYALSHSALAIALATIASLIIASVVMRHYVFNRIVRRLRGLTFVTSRLSQGDLDVRIGTDGADEITDLQHAVTVFRENALILAEREQALARRTTALEIANKELDNFAYVASHDLRAPLRSLDSLASFVLEDAGDKLAEHSIRHLNMMRGRIRRLDALLVGLLEYSRIGQKESAFEVVDLEALVRGSADLVIAESFELSVFGEFPTVRTAKAPLEQVVRNLVDNAVKHHDRDAGKIALKGTMGVDEFVLEITDDGPGIDRKYHDKIFGFFQTLQSRDKIEGSGMGLSVLKKSIEHFNGSIAVDSDPDNRRGTTFTIRWPVEIMADSPPLHGTSTRLQGQPEETSTSDEALVTPS